MSQSIVWRTHSVEVCAEEAESGANGDVFDSEIDHDPRFCVPFELAEGAKVPARASENAAGFDIFASEGVTLPARCGWTPVGTGFKMAMNAPENVLFAMSTHFTLFAKVQSRSGMAKRGVTAFPGVIDGDYRGEVIVMLRNDADTPFDVKAGDRIAQLTFEPAYLPNRKKCSDVAAMYPTKRGAGGFGSTGGAAGASPRVPEQQPVQGA